MWWTLHLCIHCIAGYDACVPGSLRPLAQSLVLRTQLPKTPPPPTHPPPHPTWQAFEHFWPLAPAPRELQVVFYTYLGMYPDPQGRACATSILFGGFRASSRPGPLPLLNPHPPRQLPTLQIPTCASALDVRCTTSVVDSLGHGGCRHGGCRNPGAPSQVAEGPGEPSSFA